MSEYILDINRANRYRIEVSEFKGTMRLDVRKQFLSEDDETWINTKQGVNIKLDQVKELLELIHEATFAELNAPTDDAKTTGKMPKAPRAGSPLERVISKNGPAKQNIGTRRAKETVEKIVAKSAAKKAPTKRTSR